MFKNKFFSWINFRKNKKINKVDSTVQKKSSEGIDDNLKNNDKTHVINNLNEKLSSSCNIDNKMRRKLLQESRHVKTNLNLDLKSKNNSVKTFKKDNFFAILTKKLMKTKVNFGIKLKNLFLKNKINDSLFNDIEEQLLISDVGVDTTCKLIDFLIKNATQQELKDSKLVFKILKDKMENILKKVESPLNINHKKLFIILVVGVNGVGKTSVIGKLAAKYKQQGKSVMLVASDTFRAAAIDQLKFFGEKNSIPVISRESGSDPAAVVYDALKIAQLKKIDILMIDTAGRLHNQYNLMKELRKIKTVIEKVDSSFPQEVMLVLDSSIGQNSIRQAEVFNQVLNITGLVITKLDGTAKGGVIFSIARKLLIPIRYISFGENCSDIQVFNSKIFIEVIFYNHV